MSNVILNGRLSANNYTHAGEKQAAFWIPYSGYVRGAAPNNIVVWKELGNIHSIDAVELEAQDESDYFEVGRTNSTTSSGFKIGGFNISFEGSDPDVLAVLSGTNLVSQAGIRIGQSLGVRGCLVIYNFSDKGADANHLSTDVIVDCEPIIAQLPGASEGETDLVVKFRVDAPTSIYRLASDAIVAAEIWYDNGVIINANAPDGILTTFAVGTGNDSYLAPTTPTAIQVDAAATGYFKYLFGVWLEGTKQTTTQASFAAPTITFATAPANAAKLVAIYAVDASATAILPNQRDDLAAASAPGVNGGSQQRWQEYAQRG